MKWEDHGILWPKQTYNPPHQSKLQQRLVCSPASEDGQRHTTSALHWPKDDRNREQIQPDWKDALAIKWAKERLRICLLGAPRFRIVKAHKPMLPLFNKVKAKMPTQNREVGYGDARRRLWIRMQGWSRPFRLPFQTPATRDRKRQHWEDHQMDCKCRACGNHHMNQRRNPERWSDAATSEENCLRGLWETQVRQGVRPLPTSETRVISRRWTDVQITTYCTTRSLTEKSRQARTQHRTLGQEQRGTH